MKVGILGGGQLGRMLALAGTPLGLEFRFLEPARPAPVDGLGEVIRAAYDDPDGLDALAEGVDVVTYEFENVPAASTQHLEGRVPLHPPPSALADAQDRLREKEGFRAVGIPTAAYRAVDSLADLHAGVRQVGLPALLKTRRFGYDGKGQRLVRSGTELEAALDELGGEGLILEEYVPFRRELSLISVRGRHGECAFYPLIENVHRDGILWTSLAPAPESEAGLQAEAERHARALLERHDYVGVLAIEFFEREETLIANEMAPRVHNSGHWTQDGAWVCQFENHLRAVCGYPLGSTEARAPTAMLNLLGRVPAAADMLSLPGVHLHLYGKQPRPRRKLGHVNVVGDATSIVETLHTLERLVLEG